MKKILTLTIYALITLAAQAETKNLKPKKELEAAFDGCHFTMVDRLGGKFNPIFEKDQKSAAYYVRAGQLINIPFEVSLSFRCENKKGERKFEDIDVFRKDNAWNIKPSTDDPDNLANVKIFSLDSEKNIGVAMTDDQTTGAPEDRNRGLFFCLTNHEQMLCGSSEVIARVADPKTSVLPEVLEMLKSIEFLDPVEGAFTRP